MNIGILVTIYKSRYEGAHTLESSVGKWYNKGLNSKYSWVIIKYDLFPMF